MSKLKTFDSYLTEKKFDKLRKSNLAPPKDSNWFEFANLFDIGVLDLDELADSFRFKDFEDLDVSISPKDLFKRNPKKFTIALKGASLKASDMSDNEIKKKINKLFP